MKALTGVPAVPTRSVRDYLSSGPHGYYSLGRTCHTNGCHYHGYIPTTQTIAFRVHMHL